MVYTTEKATGVNRRRADETSQKDSGLSSLGRSVQQNLFVLKHIALLVLATLAIGGCRPAARSVTPTVLSPTPASSVQATEAEDRAPLADLPSPALRTAAAPGIVYEGGRLGTIWELADFRYEVYADRVRLIWQMDGGAEGVPFYRLVVVENATSPHPAAPDAPWGALRLDLIFSDVYARAFPLREHFPLENLSDAPPVVRVDRYPTFDDASLGFSVGLDRRVPLEVYELTGPARLVVDVLREP